MALRKRSETVDRTSDSPLTCRPFESTDWPAIEELFGPNGACGGCWCMWWRVPRGGKLWVAAKGLKNRAAFRDLVKNGAVHGIVAFVGDKPVGWCCLGPRSSFPRMERVRALKREWSERTWSIVCFYVPRAWQRRGVATRLLEAATSRAFEMGAGEVEGYPVVAAAPNANLPPAFAWTGVPALFERMGFCELAEQTGRRRVFLATSAPAGRNSDHARKGQSACRKQRPAK